MVCLWQERTYLFRAKSLTVEMLVFLLIAAISVILNKVSSVIDSIQSSWFVSSWLSSCSKHFYFKWCFFEEWILDMLLHHSCLKCLVEYLLKTTLWPSMQYHDRLPCFEKPTTKQGLQCWHLEVKFKILGLLFIKLLIYIVCSILIKLLAKPMLKWSLKNDICRLVHWGAICWDKNQEDLGMFFFNPCYKFLWFVNTLAIQ